MNRGSPVPEPGEHPRLFFRKHEFPEMKRRVGTPEGKRIVERLRFLLNGSDGESLPGQYNQSRRSTDDPGLAAPAGNVFTLWRAIGRVMLYRLTDDREYAELGR